MSLYVHDSDYTIFHSMRDSVQFAVERTLEPFRGHTRCKSSFVDCMGEIMHWHDFGFLEGPGWAANAVGGAYEIHCYAEYAKEPGLAAIAVDLLDHVLEDGFVEYDTGFVIPYRDILEDKLCLNFKQKDDWICPGSMAKIGFQMLQFADRLEGNRRAAVLRDIARRMATWLDYKIPPMRNGWYPRRTTRDGAPYERSAEGGGEPLLDHSADGLFIIQLMVGLTQRELFDWRPRIRRLVDAFMNQGGIFGSINHDTYDRHENVAYSVAFRVLREAAKCLNDPKIRRFAYERCLAGLDQFKMREDRNGCRTKGLLFMEKSWDTSYMWENAEAALAYIEAYEETGSIHYRDEALTILQAIAKHHHGPYGFLTEGVDWNNHVGRRHHFWKEKYGDIEYTEPLLNNIHITEPTVHLVRLWPEIDVLGL